MKINNLFRHIFHQSFFAFGILMLLSSCKTEKKMAVGDYPEEAEEPIEVIAYYTPSTGEIDKETLSQLDQIIYSFLHLDGSRLEVTERDSISLKYLGSLKEQYPDLEVLISLGGWGGCETCSDIFSTEEGRTEFAASVQDILEQYNADGIDLDWEYPAIEGHPGHSYKPADKENFTSLVEELRSTLGASKRISFAAGAFEDFFVSSVDWEQVMPLVDNVNLMTYDMYNGSSSTTGHHTALYSTQFQENSADLSVEYLDSIGVPREKMILGAAFYGRVWKDVDSVNNGLYQKGQHLESVLFHELDEYRENNPGFEMYYDSVAHAPYLYNPDKHLFITYDNPASIEAKTQYVLENNLGGVMFWQLSGDRQDEGLLDVIERTIDNFEIKN